MHAVEAKTPVTVEESNEKEDEQQQDVDNERLGHPQLQV
jgi:hypothetical protein